MTPESLFERYSHLVPELATKYNLDEDQSQELWIALWEYLNTHAFHTYSEWVAHIRSALTHRASHMRPSLVLGELMPIDHIAYSDPVSNALLTRAMSDVLETLTPREELVLRLRYYEELSQREVGEILGVTPERTRQIEAKGMRKMRHPSRRVKALFLSCLEDDACATYYMEVNHGAAQDESDSDCC